MSSYDTVSMNPMVAFGSDVLNDLENAASREWLETNGIGGFASGTVARCRRRRYHGLLFAATKPPRERKLLLTAFESALIINGKRYETSTNQYPGVVHPHGYGYLTRFRIHPWPTWTYKVDEVVMEASVWMVHGENTTVIEYRLVNDPHVPVKLELRPILAYRDLHALSKETSDFNARVEIGPSQVTLKPFDDQPKVHLAHTAQIISVEGFWYRKFQYLEEKARGLDYEEDGFCPLMMNFNLNFSPATVIASTAEHGIDEIETLRDRESTRRLAAPATVIPTGRPADSRARPLDGESVAYRERQAEELNCDPLFLSLGAATTAFLVGHTAEPDTIVAGYPWFTDWGRDTFISLPGLVLTTGRHALARNILETFAGVERDGLIPNRFPEVGEEPEYNTVDGALWYVYAVGRYLDYTGDIAFVKEKLYPTLKNIIEKYAGGTRYNIRVGTDGLVQAGEPGAQLTWMDAKIGDFVVTPRHGKPVEIQALWYNALNVFATIATALGRGTDAEFALAYAKRAADSFLSTFWNGDRGYFNDVVSDAGIDMSLRPNQVFAMSLPFTMVDAAHAQTALTTVKQDLLTPYGLRTLSKDNPHYRGRYEGDIFSRDTAYHQGTVWPYLLGPLVTAWVRFFADDQTAQSTVRGWIKPFEGHMNEAGLGFVSEIFDGDEPHTPRGCIAQAWSVAELYRCLVEDIHGVKPPVWKG